MTIKIKKIKREEAMEILDKYYNNEETPKGLFWTIDFDNGIYIGIDNLTGECWTEEFQSYLELMEWLS